MAISRAFLGHGIFTEMSVTNAIQRYANYAPPNTQVPPGTDGIDRFILALQHMEISNVWIHLFSRGVDKERNANGRNQRKDLIKRLRAKNIPWAGWGYCAANTQAADLAMITQFKNDPDIAMTAFVIDAEPGNDVPDPAHPGQLMKDKWLVADFDQFVGDVNALFGTDNLAVSTWPVLQFHDDFDATKLMKKAVGRVCLFAPQAYWMNHPGKAHKRDFDPAIFTPHDSEAYVRLVIEAWRRTGITTPLVVTGQNYWQVGQGEGTPPKADMDAKVLRVARDFAAWNQIVGFNWYHAGLPVNTDANGSMSNEMVDAIASQHLGGKPYKPG